MHCPERLWKQFEHFSHGPTTRTVHFPKRGRVGLHELLVATPEIRRLIQMLARVTEAGAAAQAGGMTTLLQDGVLKVLKGVTDMTQVKAVASK